MNLPSVRPPRLLIVVVLLPLLEPLALSVAFGQGSPSLGRIAAAWLSVSLVVTGFTFVICVAAILILLRRLMPIEPLPYARRWGLLLIAGAFSLFSLVTLDPAPARIEAKQRALQEETRILLAIDRYRRENGEIPNRLEDLVPKYMASMPDPKVAGTGVIYTPQPKPSLHFVMVTPCPGSRTPFTHFEGDGLSPLERLKFRLSKRNKS